MAGLGQEKATLKVELEPVEGTGLQLLGKRQGGRPGKNRELKKERRGPETGSFQTKLVNWHHEGWGLASDTQKKGNIYGGGKITNSLKGDKRKEKYAGAEVETSQKENMMGEGPSLASTGGGGRTNLGISSAD